MENKKENTDKTKRRGFLAVAGALAAGVLIKPFNAAKAAKSDSTGYEGNRKSISVKINPSAVKRNSKGTSV